MIMHHAREISGCGSRRTMPCVEGGQRLLMAGDWLIILSSYRCNYQFSFFRGALCSSNRCKGRMPFEEQAMMYSVWEVCSPESPCKTHSSFAWRAFLGCEQLPGQCAKHVSRARTVVEFSV